MPTYLVIKPLGKNSLFCLLTTVVIVVSLPKPAFGQLATRLTQQAQQLYENGQLETAKIKLVEAIARYTAENDPAGKAIAYRNLALLHQQQGNWQQAQQSLTRATNLLAQIPQSDQRNRIGAQILEARGQLQLARGNPQQALEAWQQAAAIYRQLEDLTGFTKNQIYAAQALQALGFYAQALKSLTKIGQQLETEPDTILKAKALQSIGEVWRRVGKVAQSRQVLEQSLAIAQQLRSSETVATTLISLGDTARIEQPEAAYQFYTSALTQSSLPTLQIEAQLKQLNLLVEQQKWQKVTALVPQIEQQLAQLPPSQTTLDGRINLARNLMQIQAQEINNSEIIDHLTTAIRLARQLANKRGEAEAIGTLGRLYEEHRRFSEAQELTQTALLLSQELQSADLAYQWQWQLGRILRATGDQQGAIAAYTQAVENLQILRGDLVAISSGVQYSFQVKVEPVYRELVGMLLHPNANQEDLEQARAVIESLQVAQLDNFFRDACLDVQPVQIDQLDPTAAIIYPILLGDRLAVIAALPGKPLRYYQTALAQEEIEKRLFWVNSLLSQPRRQPRQSLLKELYNWLIEPIEADLVAQEIATLVFVPDGALRNLPPAVLYDGEQFLVEKYNLAIAPSLQLVDPQPLAIARRELLLAGITEARQGFSPLPGVEREIKMIDAQFPARVLLNHAFTEQNFNQAVDNSTYQVIHLATHGKFSSTLENTFVLTWDGRLNISELNSLIRADRKQLHPIELLVLSACETASGDKQAALGLAGIAVRSGARSTLASLWTVSDEATTLLMTRFYQELNQHNITKAEALRRAQQAVLLEPKFAHPYYWSAFILVGNWL